MPVQTSYPGVYIEELPSGVHTITGVATSITAFVGRAQRGPVNEPTIINSYSDYDRIFGGLWQLSSMSFAVNDFFANGGSQAVIVRLAGTTATTASLSLPEDMTSPPASSLNAFSDLTLTASSPGEWGDNLSALVDLTTKDPNDLSLFNLTLTLMDSTHKTTLARERYLNLSVDPKSSRYVVTTLEQLSNLANVQMRNGVAEVPASRPAATFADVSSPPQPMPSPVFFGQGTDQPGDDGGNLTSNDFIGPGTASNKQGLYALERTDIFNILCIPPYNNDTNDDVDVDVVAAAATYCKQRRAFYIVDPPSSWTNLQTAQMHFTAQDFGITTDTSDSVAMYFPRIIEPNPLLDDNQTATFVPCGLMAGIFARTDSQRGVWKAPAGQDTGLNRVLQLAVPLTDAENGQLNPLGLNCLRTFPFIGPVAWGARTVAGADQHESQWKYIPVRRTALYIEESLYRGLKWAVFEPNDDTLWHNIRLNVGSFMHDLFRQGAFFGTSPDNAYFVKCDGETTTQSDIDAGIVNVVVGFAPLKPAEFVIIQIQQIAGQLQV